MLDNPPSDNFESLPVVLPTRAQPDPMQDDSDSGLGGEDVQLFPELKIRGSPKHLASPIKHFNACQKNAVRALGLGDILDFQVEGIPKSMCRWLISNFDSANMCLSLENGLVVPVTEEDVHYTLGLLRGSVVITRRRKDDVSDTLKEWRSKFNKVKHDVTLAMIATKVRSLLEGDVWFKRHFAVLVVSVLGGTMKNGYANQLVFHHFEDVDEIKNLNWCKFVLECLVERHAQWVNNLDKQFSGPIVFLLLLYVDRVVHSDRVVPRLVPSLRGWSSRHLKARQLSEIRSGGVGRGIVEGHLVVATDHEEDVAHGVRDSHGHTTVVKTAAEEFADKSVALGKALDDMVQFLESHLGHTTSSDMFRHVLSAARKIITLSDQCGRTTEDQHGVKTNPSKEENLNLKFS
nr:uncharacterized protein LOC109168900 [Ipomoea trifida]